MKKILFIDRDGTLVLEPPVDYQLDSFEKLVFYPQVFTYLQKIATELNYELVMVTNQDGLGTNSFPENTFWPVQNFIINTLAAEDINFSAVHIDKSFPHQNLPTRKPATGMLTGYLNGEYDIANSYVIGDRITDVQLAANLGCKAIWLNANENLGATEINKNIESLKENTVALATLSWQKIYEFLKLEQRVIHHVRNTNETKISITMNLDGVGKYNMNTGLHFFNHMLDQLSKHSGVDIDLVCNGDLEIDEHHTIEDCGLALGEAFEKALGNKRGINRYGFLLPMDDCLAHAAIDFGGRPWLVWNADFKREKVGDMPTEMFYHFFKSFADASKCNLNIKAEGDNEHHKIEAIFKAFAKAIKMAIARDVNNNQLPTTKGVL